MLGRASVQAVMLDLPIVMSVNAARTVGKVKGHWRLIDSKEYLKWKSDMGFILNSQLPGLVEGPYALTIQVSTKWRGDLGNVEKAVSDLLQSQGVVENDRYCQQILIKRADVEGMKVLVSSTSRADEDASE